MTEALQSEFEAVEPALQELARNLGQPPEEVLRSAIEAKKREWAHSKLDEAIDEARGSEFREVNLGTWADERQAEMLKRHDLK